MSPDKRSALMARIKGRDTLPERMVCERLSSFGVAWETHARDLPGRPDFVFRNEMVAVFIDGDFWHGWHFCQWRDKLSEHWEGKIQKNRERDDRNHRRLRRLGWKVVRLWEHQVYANLDAVVERIGLALSAKKSGDGCLEDPDA